MKEKQQQSKSPKKKRRNIENLTTRQIEDLMGMNMDRYERRRGAVRRK
jgi:hypothetical protein